MSKLIFKKSDVMNKKMSEGKNEKLIFQGLQLKQQRVKCLLISLHSNKG